MQKNNNVVIEGYDIEKAAIEIAREINPSAYFDVLDVTNIPIELKNKKFDYVLLLEVLEHINDYETVLENLKEMNFKKLIISVPNEPLFSYGNLIFGKNVNRLGKDIEHVNFWNSKSFETLLSKYFNVSSISKPFPWLIAECENKE